MRALAREQKRAGVPSHREAALQGEHAPGRASVGKKMGERKNERNEVAADVLHSSEKKRKGERVLLALLALLLIPSRRKTMSFLAQALGSRPSTGDIEFWHGAERSGWLMKQGENDCLRGNRCSLSMPLLFFWRTFFLCSLSFSISQPLHRGVY